MAPPAGQCGACRPSWRPGRARCEGAGRLTSLSSILDRTSTMPEEMRRAARPHRGPRPRAAGGARPLAGGARRAQRGQPLDDLAGGARRGEPDGRGAGEARGRSGGHARLAVRRRPPSRPRRWPAATSSPSGSIPASGYERRNVSPAATPDGLRLVDVRFPAGARVAFETGPREPRVHQLVWVLEGSMTVAVGDDRHEPGGGRLPGDATSTARSCSPTRRRRRRATRSS